MQTLIELYDTRPLENVLALDMFRPKQVVFLCPDDVAKDERIHRRMRRYLQHRGIDTQCTFLGCPPYDAHALLQRLEGVVSQHPDCALDITGGSDAALFAAGMLSARVQAAVFTYSRRKNRFFAIRNAPFAEDLPCDVQYRIEDFIAMAGGTTRMGRVDNDALAPYLADFDAFFDLFLRHRRKWPRIVTYLQRVSQNARGELPALQAQGDTVIKGTHGSRIEAPRPALQDLEKLGFIHGLTIDDRQGVQFTFRDLQIRTWLRDVGSVLELYVYKACLQSGLFHQVRTSVVVDWDDDRRRDAVSNEIDVMAVQGVVPLFISCKTCELHTDAINELAILRDRFGGEMARAALVSAERSGAALRNRARELDIDIIDLDDLTQGQLQARLKQLMQG